MKFLVLTYLFYIILVFLPCVLAEEAHSTLKYDSASRRDPFIPLVGPGGTVLKAFNPNDLKVEGIIYDPGKGSLALINGEFYKAGDLIHEAIITQIFKDRVILTNEGEEKTLLIREESESQGEDEKNAAHPEPTKKA